MQVALIAVFAANAVVAGLIGPTTGRPSAANWLKATLNLVCGLSMMATLVLSLTIGPWWRVPVTLLAGGAVGGIEAVILRRLPFAITVANLIASWSYLVAVHRQS
jgi:hypothetical protein